MTHPHGALLVLGIGNTLLRDDGAGVHAVRALRRLADRGDVELPWGTSLVDGGTLGLDLLPLISDARAVVLVDAVDGGRAPGTVKTLRGNALREGQTGHALANRVGVGDLLAAARLIGALPQAVALVGIQPGEIAVGLELTEVVRAAMPAAIAATLDELRRLDATAPSSGRVFADHPYVEAGARA